MDGWVGGLNGLVDCLLDGWMDGLLGRIALLFRMCPLCTYLSMPCAYM
jgi:hypothetical protein